MSLVLGSPHHLPIPRQSSPFPGEVIIPGSRMRNAAFLLFFTVGPCLQLRGNDDLIVPDLRVGPVTRMSTERELQKVFGRLAVKDKIGVGEGVDEPGLVIYPGDPARRLEITWNDEQPPHPAIIFICPGDDNRACRWHTASGISIGTTLRELERINGRPFEMVGWGSDVGGNVTSFQEGRLEKELNVALKLTLLPRIDRNGDYVPKLSAREFSEVEGEKSLRSNHPVLQKLNPHVGALRLVFPSVKRVR